MKKILFLMLFLSGVMFSQAHRVLPGYFPEDRVKNPVAIMFGFVEDAGDTVYIPFNMDLNGNLSVNSAGADTLGYGTNTIGAVEVLGGDVTTKKITIINYTTGTILYVGGDNSVTASNGMPLAYLDAYTLTVSNLNQVWLISDGSTDVRYTYEN